MQDSSSSLSSPAPVYHPPSPAAGSLYLETARVRLRQYREEDFEALVELDRDAEVMRFVGGVLAERSESIQGIERVRFYREKYQGRLGAFTAELLPAGEFMGWFLLRPDRADLENTRELELGYRLHRRFWAQGLATEVSRALVARAFTELGAECVFARALATNLGSRRVMEKAGLRFEREYLDPTHERQGPTAEYRLPRAEWAGLFFEL